MSGAEASASAPGTLELRRYRDEDARAVRELHDLALMAAGVHLGRGPWDGDLDDIPPPTSQLWSAARIRGVGPIAVGGRSAAVVT